MLIAFAGLPGVGKSTIARALAAAHPGSVYLRIDMIEQALRDHGVADVGPLGYAGAYAAARDNLRLGRMVIADSVNPIPLTREAWRRVASEAGARVLRVEVLCSDRATHRLRVETRAIDVPGLARVSWMAVEAREYAPYTDADVRIDTAAMSIEGALAAIASAIEGFELESFAHPLRHPGLAKRDPGPRGS
ncbi:MAG: AAA family ATPase [Alphaproteobacteria bacterium]|nr:AAA family ATPase [Alphaproteobacteria bacterium]